MKKVLFILLIFILGLTACKEDEPDTDNPVIEDSDTKEDENTDNSGGENSGENEGLSGGIIVEDTSDDTSSNNNASSGNGLSGGVSSGSDGTQGDEGTASDNSGQDNNEALTAVVMATEKFVYEYDASQAFLYVENEQLTELQESTFLASYTHDGKTYNVEFQWCVKDNELMYRIDEELFEEIHLQKIPGCTDKILIARGYPQEGTGGFQVCNLEKNTIEPLLGGRIDEKFSRYEIISVKSDLSAVIAVDRKAEEVYYYDTQQTIDLKQKICDDTGKSSLSVHGSISEDEIIVYATEKSYGDNVKLYVYRYHLHTGKVSKVIDGTLVTDVVLFEELTAVKYSQGGVVYMCNSRTGQSFSLEIEEAKVRSYKTIGDDYLVITSPGGFFVVYQVSTGRRLVTAQISGREISGYTIIPSYENLYIGVVNNDKTYIYEITLP